MNCEICGKDPETIVILPIKRQNGSLITMACLECSENSSAYCTKHNIPHLGFDGDDTTACRLCIGEVVQSQKNDSDRNAEILKKLLPNEEFLRLIEAAEISSAITGHTVGTSISRFIATRAFRSKKKFEEILEDVLQQQSVEAILYTSVLANEIL